MKKDIVGLAGIVSLLSGTGFIITSVGIFAFQFYEWLRFGEWPELSSGTVVEKYIGHVPEVSWKGVAQIISWMLALDAKATLFMSGVLVLVVVAAPLLSASERQI